MKRVSGLSDEVMEEMVENGTMDTYDDREAMGGMTCMVEEYVRVPFSSEVLGLKVVVESIVVTKGFHVLAVCVHKGLRQKIPLLELTLPDPPPEGVEWIDAWRFFITGE